MYNDFDHYGRGREFMPAVEKVIRPDMPSYARKLKIFSILSYIGIAVCFMAFGITGFSFVSNMHFSPFIFVPFFGFGGCGILAAFYTPRAKMAESIVSVLNQIKGTDRMEISNISYTFKNFSGDVLYIVKLLISTGNLADYKIIDDRIVARIDAYVPPPERNEAKTSSCPDCGAELRKTDAFCPKCGKKVTFSD